MVELLVAGGAAAGGAEAGTSSCVSGFGGDLTANIESVLIEPEYRLNGAPFPVDPANSARISLVANGVVQVDLGTTDQPAAAVRVVAGTYDLLYAHETGALVPRNTAAIFARGVDVLADGPLVVDVPSVVQSGDFRLDGAPFPAVDFEDALIFARRAGDASEVLLGNTHDGSYSHALIPGEYEIVYRRESGGSLVPHNDGAVIDTRDVVANDFDADVATTSVVITGDFSINSTPPPNLAFENGEIRLRTPEGDEVLLGETRDQSYSARVIPGTYDVHYSVLSSAGVVPENPDKRLMQGVNVQAGTLDVDVGAKTVVGDFTRNGAPTPAVSFERGTVSFVDRETGAETVAGDTSDQDYSVRLAPGTYDLLYRVLSAATSMPVNDSFAFDRVTISPGGLIQVELDVEIPMTTVEVDSTLDAALWPAGGNSEGELRLHAEDGSPSVTLGSTQDLPIEVPVVSGAYRFGYSFVGGKGVPRNVGALFDETHELDGSTDAEAIAVVSVPVVPDLTLDGIPFPATPSDAGRIFLAGPLGVVELGPTSAAPVAVPAIEGEYELLYAHDAGAAVPRNFLQPIGCFVLIACLLCDGFESGDPDAWSAVVP